QVPARVLVRVRHPDRPAEPEVARLVPRQPEGELLRAGGVRARGPQGARDRGRLRVDLRRGAAVVDARGQTQGPARGLRPGPARRPGAVAHPPIVTTAFVIGARAALRSGRSTSMVTVFLRPSSHASYFCLNSSFSIWSEAALKVAGSADLRSASRSQTTPAATCSVSVVSPGLRAKAFARTRGSVPIVGTKPDDWERKPLSRRPPKGSASESSVAPAARPARTAATLCASRSARWAARIASTVCGVTSSKLAGRSGSFSRRRTST